MTSNWVESMFFFVPSTALSWSWSPCRVDKRSIRSVFIALYSSSRTKVIQDHFRCLAPGVRSPKTLLKDLSQTSMVCLHKTHFLHWSLILTSQENRIESGTRPDLIQFLSKSNALKTFKVTNIGRRERPRWTDCRIRQILPQGSLPELEEFHVSCLPNEGLSTVENHRYYYTRIHLITRRGRP